jgi:hypothetical protein
LIQGIINQQEALKWRLDPFIPASIKRRALTLQNMNLRKPEVSRSLRQELLTELKGDVEEVAVLTGLDTARWIE